MRIIKFRAWDKENKKMIWPDTIKSEFYFDEKGFDGIRSGNLWVSFGFFELMQFTGLLDRNGREIYEGDIIGREGVSVCPGGKWQPEREVVAWEESGYVSSDSEYSGPTIFAGYDFGDGHAEDYKILGNIYENPELLKAQDAG